MPDLRHSIRPNRIHISPAMKRELPDEELARAYAELRAHYLGAAQMAFTDGCERNYQRLAAVFRLFAKIRQTVVLDAQLLPDEDGLIYVANHIGSFDQFYIPSLLGTRPLHYLVKEKVTTWPVRWNLIYKPTGVVVVNPDSRQIWLQAKAQLIALLLRGKNVFIFPEGSRRGEDNMGRFNAGVAQIAQEAERRVVTLAIKNCATLFSKKPVICVGETLEISRRDDTKEATAAIRRGVEKAYDKIVRYEKGGRT